MKEESVALMCRVLCSDHLMESRSVWCIVRGSEEGCVPLPFDHFFFCFLPPVAAGA